jgi:hypothetical protein
MEGTSTVAYQPAVFKLGVGRPSAATTAPSLEAFKSLGLQQSNAQQHENKRGLPGVEVRAARNCRGGRAGTVC